MKRTVPILLLSLGLIGLAGCSEQQNSPVSVNGSAIQMQKTATPAPEKPDKRWYSQQQVVRGDALFQQNCASCHKADASGTPNWKELDANDKYPPPPLNGTAHAWHHPLSILRRTVRKGGIPLGGTMPAFGDKLDSQQIDEVLAWVQSHWSEKIYSVWQERNVQASSPRTSTNKG